MVMPWMFFAGLIILNFNATLAWHAFFNKRFEVRQICRG
jgi:hypothetical protein